MSKRFANRLSKNVAILLLAGLPAAALAHTGQGGHGFIGGFAHPFLGADHLLAMLLVGVWSVLHARHVWLAPLCFVSLLASGALLGQNGFAVSQIEPLVAASVLVLGVMLALPFHLGLPAALAVIGGLAVFHGIAHGSELAAGSRPVLAGIVLGSAALHAAGMAFAHLFLRKRPRLTHRLGQFMALLGGGLMVSTMI